jgi:uncharacterized protein YheU (UPF0270 family)
MGTFPPPLPIAMLIPYEQLEADTLTRLIEDFVTRDGTDNGDDTPLETRVLRVRQALARKQAFILFDFESEQLLARHDVPAELLAPSGRAFACCSLIRLYTSTRCTSTLRGALMPKRTWPFSTDTTWMLMSSPMKITSPTSRPITNMLRSSSLRENRRLP